jgi:hypothetical protein
MSATKPPSGRHLEIAMAIAQATIARLEVEGVTTDEDELVTLLRDQGADVETLLVRLLRASKEAEGRMDALAQRMSDMADRKARFARQYQEFRKAALAMIDALPEVFPGGSYRGAEFTASVHIGTPKPVITNVDALPDHCCRISRLPSMPDIRALLKRGPVPGVELTNGAPQLTVRTR